MAFESFALSNTLLKGLVAAGYLQPTAIQEKAIPQILNGRDVIGCAQTGTGKTAAFVVPMLQQLLDSNAAPTGAARRRQRSGRRPVRALIVGPTRELVDQIGDCIATYGQFTGLRHFVLYGGVGPTPQIKVLNAGIDVLVATPGRLLDLLGQRHADLEEVEILVLDEADRMLDMGFINDLRKIIAATHNRRQTLMFSATMPPQIRKLAQQWLRRPREIQATPVASTPARMDHIVYHLERPQKISVLANYLTATDRSRTLVFSRTKAGADRIARKLNRAGIVALALHGDKRQGRRRSILREFQSSDPPVLVATDVAARGLDFDSVTHVINFDLPDVAETYVHRTGRTARAGSNGLAVSFCEPDQHGQLKAIERLIGQQVSVHETPAAWLPVDDA